MNRLRAWLNRHQTPTVVAMILVIVAGVATMFAGDDAGAPPIPEADYRCERGHAWRQPVTAEPACPQCSAPGITESRYRCPGCDEVFTGVLVQKLGPGRFRYRSPRDPNAAWLDASPSAIACPGCGRTGDPSLRFQGLGYDGTGPAAPPADHVN